MRLCITAEGPGLESSFEERFGRAPFFIFCDPSGENVESVPNPFSASSGGVGPRAVQLLVDGKADVLITGRLGENAKEAFLATGKSAFVSKGGRTASDVLGDYRNGSLARLE